MPLNRACVGRGYLPVTTEATLEGLQTYARAYNDDNLAFFDAARPGGIVAPPMYAVVAMWPALVAVMADPELGVNLMRLLHAEQDMEFLGAIRPGDRIASRAKVVSVEAQATGEMLAVEIDASNHREELVSRAHFGALIRGTPKRSAVGARRRPRPERGAPAVEVSQTIDPDQTYRYRDASGDINPIHVDENFARMVGLPGIIVHGLCTMAFTSKVMIDELCGRDPLRLKRLRVRFSRPVFPGQTITTRVWPADGREGVRIYAYETCNPAGQPVITDAVAEIAC